MTLQPPIYIARNTATGDLLRENGAVVEGVYTWVASRLQALVSDANRSAFELVRADDVGTLVGVRQSDPEDDTVWSVVSDSDEGPTIDGTPVHFTSKGAEKFAERLAAASDAQLQAKYDAVIETLDLIGAPTHEGDSQLNANGRLEDWLELHGYHPHATGSARARREDDDNAFRYMARIRAILDDYEAGKVTYQQVREYVLRTTTNFAE